MSAESVRATYDTVASDYDAQLRDELDHKPLDRALLAALVELCGGGPIADVGCGPGHVTRHLASLGADVSGVDLSPRMIEIARSASGTISFTTASMLELPFADGSLAGVVAPYSIIHLTTEEQSTAFAEFTRVLRPGGWVLLAFHVDSTETPAGHSVHLTTWFGHAVEVDTFFLDPDQVTVALAEAGLPVQSRTDRCAIEGREFPSRRCYLMARKAAVNDPADPGS